MLRVALQLGVKVALHGHRAWALQLGVKVMVMGTGVYVACHGQLGVKVMVMVMISSATSGLRVCAVPTRALAWAQVGMYTRALCVYVACAARLTITMTGGPATVST